LIEFCHDKSL